MPSIERNDAGSGHDSRETGPERIGPYRLEAELAAGGMSRVYRAVDERLGRPVAVKRLTRARTRQGLASERFWREARAVARLSHPAIVQIYDIVEDDAGGWIVMELVEGRTLASLIHAGGLEVAAALPLFCDVTEGLAEAHAKGVLHRDLKSENVMVTPSGHAKLLDFGLARRIATEGGAEPAPASEPSVTIEGRIVGTPHAMSPEQALSGELDHRSDLFSLGSMLYESLTGERPFSGGDDAATLHRICGVQQRPASELNPAVPDELSRLVDRLLEKHPLERPQSAREVARALRHMAGLDSRGHFESGVAADSERRRSASASTAERRQVTVVHCELVTREEPSGVLDPEELLETRPRLESLAEAVAERFGGRVGHVTDHGLRLHFGYPRAHEDDAWRGVRAARDLVSGVEDLAANSGEPLAIRVGVHSGPVVVAGADEHLVLGGTASLAAGIMSLAPPGEVLLSAATRQIVRPYALTEALAPARVPGLADPVRAYRISSEVDSGDATGALVYRTSMVGREQELELLLDRLDLAREGTGQAVLLGGTAGIGKTRLVRALHQQVRGTDTTWLWGQCSSIDRNTPFAPIADMLRRLIRSDAAAAERPSSPAADSDRQRAALEAFLRPYEAELPGAARALADLLALPTGNETPEPVSPRQKRRQIIDTLLVLPQLLAEERPLLMVVEDLQWADPSTLELLELLTEQVQAAKIFLLVTSRPELEPPWAQGSHLTQLTLGRFNQRQTEELIRRLGGGDLPPPLVDMIAGKTDGVPHFIEEVTRAVIESPTSDASASGTGSLLPAIPVKLQDFLTARLDRLGEAKAVAQQAAALGRTFRVEVLAAVSPLAEDELVDHLEDLVRADVIFRQDTRRPPARYTFKNALIQDAAHLSLLRRERRRLHGRIAEILEKRFPAIARDQPELLAHHSSEAGQVRRAIPLWLRAAEKAVERSADAEAVAHLDRGLELLAELPAGPERERRERELRLAREGCGLRAGAAPAGRGPQAGPGAEA